MLQTTGSEINLAQGIKADLINKKLFFNVTEPEPYGCPFSTTKKVSFSKFRVIFTFFLSFFFLVEETGFHINLNKTEKYKISKSE